MRPQIEITILYKKYARFRFYVMQSFPKWNDKLSKLFDQFLMGFFSNEDLNKH